MRVSTAFFCDLFVGRKLWVPRTDEEHPFPLLGEPK
jgi:hypothetical protein